MTADDMLMAIGHEKLRVYQRGLEYVSWTHAVLVSVDQSAVVFDHWDRAAESIVENIANGNSRRSRADRNQYFDVSVGSALECAACLDICGCRRMITEVQRAEGKGILQQIVNMTIGLRESQSAYVKEDRDPYAAGQNGKFQFAHEGLDVYQVALEMIVWFDGFLKAAEPGISYAKRLDIGTTSLVLNIAEGNGRFSEADQMRFLDIAHTCAMRVAVCLDVLVARKQLERNQVEGGKRILARIVPLLLGLRGCLGEPMEQG